jgi:uncharacterized protein YfaP (DUF2135 family)
MNAIAASSKVDVSKADHRLIHPMPVNVRVVLNWDTDNADMDLWVTDPRGEKCFFSHKLTAIGGRLSMDFTQGYGPEEFLLKRAMSGTYKVQANYYGTRQQTAVIGPTTLHAELYLHYGTSRQQRKDIILRLDGRGALVNVGEFSFQEKN